LFIKANYLKYLIFIAFLGSPFLSHLQTSDAIKFFQVVATHNGLTKEISNTPANKTSTLDFCNAEIQKLHIRGYLEAATDSLVQKNNTLLIFITIGPEYTLQSINLIDFQTIVFQRGMEFSTISRMIRRELSFQENNGHPFAKIQSQGILDSSNITLEITLDKGPLVEFDSLIIKSEESFDYNTIKRIFNFKSDKLYSENYAKGLSKIAKDNSFFGFNKPPKISFRNDKASVTLFLKKKKTSRFDGILGLQPSIEGSTSVTGLISLDLTNILNRAESLSLNWERLRPENQRLAVNVKTPFLFNTFLSIELNTALIRQDSTINRISIDYGAGYQLNPNNRLSFLIGQTKNNSNQNDNQFTQNTNSTLYRAEWRYANLDTRLNPAKGFTNHLGLSLGHRTSASVERAKLIGLTYKGSKHIKLLKRSSLVIGASGESISSQNILENEVLQIGGLGSIRGTDQRTIPTTSWITQSLEYRYLLDENSHVFGFYEKNYFEKNTLKSYQKGSIDAFGLGVSIGTNSGLFTFLYGISNYTENRFLFRNAKINFGYISTF
jgi:outer membrane translocation and assembly module TamA